MASPKGRRRRALRLLLVLLAVPLVFVSTERGTVRIVRTLAEVILHARPVPPLPRGGSIHARGSFIAHAGGPVDGRIYTNSREAVEDSLCRGFNLIELDLQRTRDGHLVAVHDWKLFAQATGKDPQAMPPTLAEARQSLLYGTYHVLTARDIRELMHAHPQMVLVTDKIEDFALLHAELPLPQRMLVEVFKADWSLVQCLWYGYTPALSLPWKADRLDMVQEFDLPFYTVSAVAWERGHEALLAYVKKLVAAGKEVLLYTSDVPAGAQMESPEFLQQNLGVTCTRFYTNLSRRFSSDP